MSIFRELDNRKMRDRDASLGSGDRGNAPDMGTSTGSGGNWGDPGSTTGRGLEENTSTNGQDWDQPGTHTGGGMDRTIDTASGGNWGNTSGLSGNAAGPGAGNWISGDNNTGYKEPDKNRGS